LRIIENNAVYTQNMKKHLFTILGFILVGLTQPSAAQESSLLHFMNTTPQALRSNPANFPDSIKLFFGVPLLSNINVGMSSPLAWSDVFAHRGDSLYVQPDLLHSLSDDSRVLFSFNYDIFNYGQRFGKHFLTVGLAAKGYGKIGIPQTAADLFVNGNKNFIDKSCDIDASVHGFAYGELAVGYGYEFNKNWTVGGRVKLLGGIAGAHSESIKASLITDPDTYNLTGTSDILIKTASGHALQNMGVGFDVGVQYKPTDEFELGLSLVDWGFIKWNGGLTEYAGTGNDKTFSFGGITNIGSGGDMMRALVDTLKH